MSSLHLKRWKQNLMNNGWGGVLFLRRTLISATPMCFKWNAISSYHITALQSKCLDGKTPSILKDSEGKGEIEGEMTLIEAKWFT